MIKKIVLSVLIIFSLLDNIKGQCIPPNISASFFNMGNCTFKLIGNSTIFGPQFAWNGPSIPANSPNPFIATTAGIYTLTVTNPTTGCTSTATVNITGVSSPTLTPSAPLVLGCAQSTGTIGVTSSGTSAVTYSWSGPGIISGSSSSSPNVNVPGLYSVTVTDAGSGCSSFTTVAVTQNSTVPTVSVSVSGSLTCTNSLVTLSGASSSSVSYNWLPLNANTQNVSVTIGGTYTVVVTNAVNNCTNSAAVTVNQNTLQPNVSIAGGGSLTCLNASLTLIGNSTTSGVTFSWQPGSILNPSLIVTAPGTYSLIATSSLTGCKSTTIINIGQNIILPTISASVSAILNCTLTSVNLIGNSTTPGVNYSWSPIGVPLFSAAVNNPGTYSLTVTNTITGCKSTTVISVSQNTVIPSVSVSIGGTLTCVTPTIALSGVSNVSGVNFQWVGGPSSQNYSVNSPGTYTLIVLNPTNGCTNTALATVTQSVNFPNISIVAPSTLSCNNPSVNLIGNSTTSGVNFNWLPQNSNTPNVNINTPGNYTLVVTDPSNSCKSYSTITVNQAPILNFSLSSSTLTCFGLNSGTASISASNGTGNYSYQWSNNQTTSSINNLGVGNYSVNVIDNGTGCIKTASFTITQAAEIQVSISTPKNTVCKGSNITLNAIANNAQAPLNFNWSNSQTTNPAQSIMQTSNNFFVTVTDANNCSGSASMFIDVLPQPDVTFSASLNYGCAPLCVTFTPSVLGMVYTWDFGNGNQSNLLNPKQCFTNAGEYNVSLNFTDANGCKNVKSIPDYIHIYPVPVSDFIAPFWPITSLDPQVNFTNTSQGSTGYFWNFGEPNTITFSTSENPTHSYINNGDYLVTLIASNQFGCSDTSYKKITIADDFSIYVPNAFTPNGDNLNDTFYPVISGFKKSSYSFIIYDRWGEKIFSSTDYEAKGWDGTFKGEICKDDAYTWKLSVSSERGPRKEYVGHVTLYK